MKTSQIIFLGLALFLAVQSAAANYPCANCGLGSGTDACGCSEFVVKAAKPIRPKLVDPCLIKESLVRKSTPPPCGSVNPSPCKIHAPQVDVIKFPCGPIAPKFSPVGDLCSCKSTIAEVIPAYPGKLNCGCCAEKVRNEDCGCASNKASYTSISTSSNAELNGFADDCLSFDEQEHIYNSQSVPVAPADPVSLSLAYGLSQKTIRTVPEGSLNFGPKSIPIDGSIRKKVVDIPEEKLLTVDRPVVELRYSPRSSASATYAEVIAQQEALEERRLELEAQAEASQGQSASFISFSDLGYAPVVSTGNNFVSTVTSGNVVTAESESEDSGCGPLGAPLPGYVSGNVIIRSAAAQENDADYYAAGSYEQGSEEDQYGNQSYEDSESYSGVSGFRGSSGLSGSTVFGVSSGSSGCGGSSGSSASSGFLAKLRASAHAQNAYGCGCGH